MKALIAVDDTDPSWDAARFAGRLLAEDDEVVVLNVAKPRRPMYMTAGGLAGYPAPTRAATPDATERRNGEARAIANTAASVAQADRAIVAEGDAGETICRIANEEGSDLIVVGTQDKNALVRLFTGSVSDYVLKHAPCPVLVVR